MRVQEFLQVYFGLTLQNTSAAVVVHVDGVKSVFRTGDHRLAQAVAVFLLSPEGTILKLVESADVRVSNPETGVVYLRRAFDADVNANGFQPLFVKEGEKAVADLVARRASHNKTRAPELVSAALGDRAILR